MGYMSIAATSYQLRDSRPLLGDWRALRAQIAAYGYVFMPGLLDAATVRRVGQTGMDYLQQSGWTEPGPDPVAARPRQPVRAVKMRDAFGDPGYRRILLEPGFNMIPFTSPMTELMEQILGPAGFCYPLKLPRIVYPAAVVPRHPGNMVHQDYRSVQDMFTCWVPLGDVPQSLGGLAVAPGSQTTSRVRHRPLEFLEPGWLTADYRAGDVLVFHCLTTHAALPNQENRMRFSVEYRWQLADQPAPRGMVVGPRGNEMGSQRSSPGRVVAPGASGPHPVRRRRCRRPAVASGPAVALRIVHQLKQQGARSRIREVIIFPSPDSLAWRWN